MTLQGKTSAFVRKSSCLISLKNSCNDPFTRRMMGGFKDKQGKNDLIFFATTNGSSYGENVQRGNVTSI